MEYQQMRRPWRWRHSAPGVWLSYLELSCTPDYVCCAHQPVLHRGNYVATQVKTESQTHSNAHSLIIQPQPTRGNGQSEEPIPTVRSSRCQKGRSMPLIGHDSLQLSKNTHNT